MSSHAAPVANLQVQFRRLTTRREYESQVLVLRFDSAAPAAVRNSQRSLCSCPTASQSTMEWKCPAA